MWQVTLCTGAVAGWRWMATVNADDEAADAENMEAGHSAPGGGTAGDTPSGEPAGGKAGPHAPSDPENASPSRQLPGSLEAIAHGCRCPMLANASYRAGRERVPLLAPDCPLHRNAPQ